MLFIVDIITHHIQKLKPGELNEHDLINYIELVSVFLIDIFL